MEKTKKETKKVKTKVFNVVVLDRSGSMMSVRRAAVDGFNETLSGIQRAQEKFAATQEHFVTLVAFCGCQLQTVLDQVPAAEASPLRMEDYMPCCSTPLYDAMGITLTAIRKHVKDIEDSVVVATIITDGEENSSSEYNGGSIRRLVEELKGEGWTFTYMGANQDSAEVAMKMSIRNARNFDYSAVGTMAVMKKDTDTRMNFFSRLSNVKQHEMEHPELAMDNSERNKLYTSMADEAFDETENNGI